MKYDFESIIDRHGRDALAVDAIGTGWAPNAPKEGFDVIPMWVADMNFPTAPTVCKAMAERISHPAFGYFEPREEYYESIIRWQRERNGVNDLAPEHIGYENGVLGGVVSAMVAAGGVVRAAQPQSSIAKIRHKSFFMLSPPTENLSLSYHA